MPFSDVYPVRFFYDDSKPFRAPSPLAKLQIFPHLDSEQAMYHPYFPPSQIVQVSTYPRVDPESLPYECYFARAQFMPEPAAGREFRILIGEFRSFIKDIYDRSYYLTEAEFEYVDHPPPDSLYPDDISSSIIRAAGMSLRIAQAYKDD
jgi:hypothetical protein